MCLFPFLHSAVSLVGLLCVTCKWKASSSHWLWRSRSLNKEPSLTLYSKWQNSKVSLSTGPANPSSAERCTCKDLENTNAGALKSEIRISDRRKTSPIPANHQWQQASPTKERKGAAGRSPVVWQEHSMWTQKTGYNLRVPSCERCDLEQGIHHLWTSLLTDNMTTPVPQSKEWNKICTTPFWKLPTTACFYIIINLPFKDLLKLN